MIFARPRHNYQSYSDFWRLVELCGYPVIWQDEIDTSLDVTYIFTGANCHLEFEPGKAQVIYWLAEWYGDYVQKRGVTRTWTINQTFADMIGAEFVPIGSHVDLGTPDKLEQQYDIIHLSYDAIHRRRWLLDRMIDKGVTIAPNGWDIERDRLLRSSRMMVHIHQSAEYPAIAPLRLSLAAAYKLPVLAESGWDNAPYDGAILTSDYNDMVDIVTGDREGLQVMADMLHHRMCHELRFDKIVEANV